MGAERPRRREFLAAAGAGVVTSGLGGTAVAARPGATAQNGVTGGWYITRRNTGSKQSARSVITFAAGGAFVGMDINPMSPTYLGSWARDGDQSVKVTFWFVVTDENGGQQGTARIKISARVNGDTIAGSYTGVIYVGGGRQKGSGTFHGRRIEVD
jgi:hypothetical protein